jgi:hypothetical protein
VNWRERFLRMSGSESDDFKDAEEATKADLWKEIKRLKKLTINRGASGSGTGNAAPTGYVSIVPVPKPIETKNGDLVENIKMFRTHWFNYLVAYKLESIPEREKIAALLSTIGDDCLKFYNNLQRMNAIRLIRFSMRWRRI